MREYIDGFIKKIEDDHVICKFNDEDGEFTCTLLKVFFPKDIKLGDAMRFGYKEEKGILKPDISLREVPYNKKLAKEIEDLSGYLGKIK